MIAARQTTETNSLIDYQRGAWAMIFTLLIINLFSWFVESVYRSMYRPSASSLPPAGAKGAPTLEQGSEKVTWGHRLASASRIFHDALLYLLIAVLANQIGFGLNADAVAILWTSFALFVAWSLTKFFIHSPFVDMGFSFVVGIFIITAMALAFR